jgi:hypothetical protein
VVDQKEQDAEKEADQEDQGVELPGGLNEQAVGRAVAVAIGAAFISGGFAQFVISALYFMRGYATYLDANMLALSTFVGMFVIMVGLSIRAAS